MPNQKQNNMKRILISCGIAVILLAACSGDPQVTALLDRADSLTIVDPDSALRLLTFPSSGDEGCPKGGVVAKTSGDEGCPHFSRSQRMRHALLTALAQNKAYVPFTTDSVLLEVADYYDRHGTPNQQVEAHYLLGCAYRDLGEAPRAIDAFQDAIAHADTTTTDCDYRTLCNVCSQVAHLFYLQNLMTENLSALDQSYIFANHAHDTLAAINSYAYKMITYDRMGLYDSVVQICDSVYRNVSSMGDSCLAAQYACMGINALLELEQTDKAKYYLDSYEANSGFFDEEKNIMKGREAYYNLKGRYFFSIHQYDSAEYYFRKELRLGLDFMNQNMASQGLAQIFQESHISDSAAKYSLYSYSMNDSVYAHMATEEVEQTKGMYNYSRNQKLALQEREKAEKARFHIRLLLYLIIGVLILIAIIAYRIKKKRREEKENYLHLLNQLENTQTEILRLRAQEIELDAVIREKEANVEDLKQKVALFQHKTGQVKQNAEQRLANSQTYKMLTKKANSGFCLNDREWSDLHKLVIETLPQFYRFISAKEYALGTKEYRTCILLRLHIPPLSISNILEVSPSYITKLSKQILKKLFNEDGTSKELVKRLTEFC